MIDVKIDNFLVSIDGEIVYARNRKTKADFGAIMIVSDRETRYEPYSKVLIGDEQYLVESDNPIEIRNGQYEHSITLIENIAVFSTVFPVDRQFTTVPSKTIGEILAIYKKELAFYQHFYFDFDDTDTIYNEKMINKRYEGVDFAVIVYDLFKKINAIPRINYIDGVWFLSYELYTERNNEITISSERNQNSVNDINYASEVLSKSNNVISESKGIWFPAKNSYVTPRSKSTMLQTSDWIFEFDSNINTLYQALAFVPSTYQYDDGGIAKFGNIDLLVDFTNGVRMKDEYDTLPISTVAGGIPSQILELDERPSYKQNNIYYEIGKNTIEGLYWKRDGVIFTQNIESLPILISSYLNASARKQLGEGASNYIDGSITPVAGELTLENIKCKFYYRAERNIDFIMEKRNATGFKKATILNQQKDSSVELERFMDSQSALVERIGNNIYIVTESFDDLASAWKLGDYYLNGNDYWLITEIKYTVYKTMVQVVAEFNKNFSNTNRESGVTREPSAFIYTGRTMQSNYIVRDYLIFSEIEPSMINDSYIYEGGRKVAMNIFDYDADLNLPVYNMTYRRLGDVKRINMPAYTEASNNTIIIHGHFQDARVGGYALHKIDSAWYKLPVYYTDSNFEVDRAEIVMSNTIDMLTDTDNLKYYPQVDSAPADIEIEPSVFEPHSYMILPLDKDPNNNIAITYQLIAVTQSNKIVLPNGFVKYNNLIKEFETAPNLKIYSNTEPYTIFDKKAKGVEISGNINLTDTYLEISDALDDMIDYWAIVIDDEIIIAGNGIKTIYYVFNKNRFYLDVSDFQQYDIYLSNEFTFTADYNILLRMTNPVFNNEFSLNATSLVLEIINQSIVLFNNLTNLTVTYDIGTYAWEDSDVTYYNSATTKVTAYVDQTGTPRPSALNYAIDTALRLYAYNMQASSLGEYGIAGTQLDISSGTIVVSTGEDVEDVLEVANPTAFNTFKAGNMTDTVLKVTDANLTVSYWKPNYQLHGYYKVIFEEI